ncbi:MAG TPA: AAA family ATPase [Thermoanaerobaculia bacterium]|jgi:predicted ATPase|nr:AAA family ATPase [Thermoanaerobaculia bacterium]
MIPRIRQVQIQNYKSIERAVVDLEPFTAFVGPNGAGKSNFVDVLALVRDCLSESVEQAFRKRAATNALPRWGEHYASRMAVRLLVDLTDDQEAEYSFQVEWGFREGFRVLHEKCTITGKEERGFEVTGGQFVRPIPGIRPQLFPDRLALAAASATEEFRPIYDFLMGIRIYSINPSNPFLLFGASESGEDLQPDGVNAAAVLRSLEAHDPEVSARVSRVLSRIIEGLQGVGTYTNSGRVSLKFTKDVGEDRPAEFFASEMSEGTVRVLCLLLAVYQLRKPSVLIIEEPEATVHPAAAELVVQVLLDAAQDRQVLITTHSPDILDAKELSDALIRVVTMEKGRTIIAPLSSASRQAIRERLYTPGELLRINELSQDAEAAQEAAQAVDLFTETLSGS